MTRVNYAYPMNSIIVNTDAYKKLPDDLKLILVESAREYQDRLWFLAYKMNAGYQATLIKNGMKVLDMPPDTRAKIIKVTSQVWKMWKKKSGPDGEKLVASYLNVVGKGK